MDYVFHTHPEAPIDSEGGTHGAWCVLGLAARAGRGAWYGYSSIKLSGNATAIWYSRRMQVVAKTTRSTNPSAKLLTPCCGTCPPHEASCRMLCSSWACQLLACTGNAAIACSHAFRKAALDGVMRTFMGTTLRPAGLVLPPPVGDLAFRAAHRSPMFLVGLGSGCFDESIDPWAGCWRAGGAIACSDVAE